MSDTTIYARAKSAFEQMSEGERISAQELAEKIGAEAYAERKNVKGRARKSIGENRRMLYERIDCASTPMRKQSAPQAALAREFISLGEIGEGIIRYIEALKGKNALLERERDRMREKLSIASRHKEAFKKLYQEAEERIRELSQRRPVEARTIRLSRILED